MTTNTQGGKAKKARPTAKQPAAKDTKSKGGRPSKYRPDMCETVIEMGKQGASKAQIASELGIHIDTIYDWDADESKPEFSEALKLAMTHSQAWWENLGRDGISQGQRFNATAFIFQMKNRFSEHYKDRTEHEHSGPGGGPVKCTFLPEDKDV